MELTPGIEVRCPRCAHPLEQEPSGSARCRGCRSDFPVSRGLLDLLAEGKEQAAPLPLRTGELDRALSRLDSGADYKSVLEELLAELPLDRGGMLDLFLRESRGSWMPLLRGTGGAALLIGNGFSGTALALERGGYDVTTLDPSAERLAWGCARTRALGGRATAGLVADPGAPLPFPDRCFDLVVREGRPPGSSPAFGRELDECRRVCRGELVLVADNRLGYKRSSGQRAKFRIPGPLEFVRTALAAPGGERSLRGYRRSLTAPDFEPARAFALYPDAHDYSMVVGLPLGEQRREPSPALLLGPKERKNRIKLAGFRAGLFPVFTSSFALIGARRGTCALPTRIETVLSELAERTDEPRPRVERWVATRGNSAVVFTGLPDRDPREPPQPAGRWVIHIPLSPAQAVRVERGQQVLAEIARHFPQLPHAEPLFAGELSGLFLSCQRRLPGISAPQLSGERDPWPRLYADAARALAGLVVEPDVTMTEEVFEQLVGAKFELVLEHARPESTRLKLRRMRDEARERMLGLRFPRVLYHADLRSKHVQVETDGRLIAFIDWGSSEPSDLPYADLVNLMAHERQHEAGLTGEQAWALLRSPERLREHEREALDDYARRLGLEPEFRRAIVEIFPVLVGGMAEKHWDFSRPRWVQRHFGI